MWKIFQYFKLHPFQALKAKVQKIYKTDTDFLYITLINKAYVNLTCNWLCNVEQFKSNVIGKTLIISLDSEVCDTIHKQWPNVNCLVFNITDEYNQPLNWGHQDYINILTLRIQIMRIIVDVGAWYVDIFNP